MSMYLAFDEDEPSFLCGDGAWDDAKRWFAALDAKKFGQLQSLGERGSNAKLPVLRKQVVRALNDMQPDDETIGILTALADAIANNPRAEKLRVTDGTIAEEDDVETDGFTTVDDDE